jgi:hypothetical protein
MGQRLSVIADKAIVALFMIGFVVGYAAVALCFTAAIVVRGEPWDYSMVFAYLVATVMFGGRAAFGFLDRFPASPRTARAIALAAVLLWQLAFGAWLAYELYRFMRGVAGRAAVQWRAWRAEVLPRAVAKGATGANRRPLVV